MTRICLPLALVAGILTTPVFAQSFDFGDDSSEWANDGECDDRRFAGPGTSMDSGFVADDVGKDASDCRRLLEEGKVYVWQIEDARAATQCATIDFGTNDGEWANNNQCDDPRFEGPGAAEDLISDDISRDAADCRRMCRTGKIFLRDYQSVSAQP
jgi:hypothetical protein